MEVVNAYTISPRDIKQGDVMLFVVKAMVTREGWYRIYRCEYTGSIAPDDIPQGSRVYSNEKEVCEALFPSLAMVAEPE